MRGVSGSFTTRVHVMNYGCKLKIGRHATVYDLGFRVVLRES